LKNLDVQTLKDNSIITVWFGPPTNSIELGIEDGPPPEGEILGIKLRGKDTNGDNDGSPPDGINLGIEDINKNGQCSNIHPTPLAKDKATVFSSLSANPSRLLSRSPSGVGPFSITILKPSNLSVPPSISHYGGAH
jgi:hypothetical protein